MIKHSDILENEYALYVAGTTYGDGDHCIYAHKIYESRQAANTGNTPSSSPTWWEDLGYDNRWQVFDLSVQSQSDQATSMTWVLRPGSTVDSAAILNIDADSVRIRVANAALELCSYGTAWTGASGSTPPTGWNATSFPATDYAIDSGWLKITGSGTQQHTGVWYGRGSLTPGDTLQLVFKYKNSVGSSRAEYRIFDDSNSADIVAITELTMSTAEATFSYTFTVPAGCTTIKFYLLAKLTSDIVWFDDFSLLKIQYDSGVVSMTSATDYVTTALTSYANPQITVIVAKSTTAYCGEIIIGAAFSLGTSLQNPKIGIDDYSIVETDEYGNFTITERAYAKKLTGESYFLNTSLDSIAAHITANRATPVVYIYNPSTLSYSCMIIYGFPKTWEIAPHNMRDYSLLSIEFRGLT